MYITKRGVYLNNHGPSIWVKDFMRYALREKFIFYFSVIFNKYFANLLITYVLSGSGTREATRAYNYY